tara:strand:- start:267 stop:893 length:627 start_codon:yes stop_codon:yes gene_type:complete
MINEREQMKDWIAISESQQIEEGFMQTIMTPFKWLGSLLVGVWNLIKGVFKIFAYLIEFSGKATMIVAAPLSWISRGLVILFRALAGTGHFLNDFGKDIRRFMESEGIDGHALMEEKGDVLEMIQNIHDTIKQLNAKTTPEMKQKFAELADPENEESQKLIALMSKQAMKMMNAADQNDELGVPKSDQAEPEPQAQSSAEVQPENPQA